MPFSLKSGRLWLWLAPGLLWLAFALWYTNTAGSLTPEEAAEITSRLLARGATPERLALVRRLWMKTKGISS